MARQLNVNLVFNANTTQAKQQMAGLQNSINGIQSSLNQQIKMNGLTNELTKAQSAVINLKTSLNSAFDVDTGKLNLNKFNAQLNQSGMSIKSYRIALQQLGPEGRNAFNQLTQAIIQGQMPIQKTKNLLTSMMDTFGSSIKWSIAYGAINKISQGFQEAFQYAQELNQSLTDIRVVTGLGAEEMARFAEKANKAAKILATTTTDYTKAALIYYQQGLSGKAIEERAETTLKLANVTGQTAETVSDQMTAVWNNFYDGSKSLEYYADVLTALGAATASSTDEISQGLEKFAAVADTVGLSYEYATTALATVTAQTRQSADVVGTAFKTLFARIQDLELGKTLDDGTTLGTYSQALQAVGVNIKSSNGDLKDMDLILNELGAKWQQIDKDQQIALAKSVAGIRQYTQLIALMDNWDTFQVNLSVAETAEGTLQEQQDIWAESWEAAQKRVKASIEDLYNSLIDDKFFIDLNNVFADLLNLVDDFLDAIGGLKTLLPLVGGLLMQAFGPMALTAIKNTFSGFKGQTAQMATANALREAALKENIAMGNESDAYGSRAQATAHEHTLKLLKQVEQIQHNLSKIEIEQLQTLSAKSQEWNNILIAAGKHIDQLDFIGAKLNEQQSRATIQSNIAEEAILDNVAPEHHQRVSGLLNTSKEKMNAATNAQIGLDTFNEANIYDENGQFNLAKAKSAVADLNKSIADGVPGAEKFKKQLADFSKTGSAESFKTISGEAKKMNPLLVQSQEVTDELAHTLKDMGYKDATKLANNFSESQLNLGKATVQTQSHIRHSEAAMEQYETTVKTVADQQNRLLESAKKMAATPLSETFISLASGIGSAAAGINMLYGGISQVIEMFKTGEHTLGGWLGVFTTMGFALPMVVNGVTQLSKALEVIRAKIIVATAATDENTIKTIKNNMVKKVSKVAADTDQNEHGETAESIKWETIQLKELNKEQLKSIGLKQVGKNQFAKIDGTEFTNSKGNLQPTMPGTTKLGTLEGAGDLTFQGNGTKALTNKMGANLKNFGTKALKAAPAILGIAVAIGAVAGAYVLIDNALHKEEKAMKSAVAAAEQLKKEYEQVATKTENMKSTMEEYESATESLRNLTKGTIEYKEALIKANEQAMELIKNNQNLKYSVINGQIVIDEASLEQAYEEQLSKQQQALKSSSVATQAANRAKANNNTAEFAKNAGSWSDFGQGAANTGIGAAGGGIAGAAAVAGIGATIGSTVPVVGTIIGAVVGLAIGAIAAGVATRAEGIASQAEKDAIGKLQKISRDNPDILNDKTAVQATLLENGVSQNIVDALTEDMDALRALVESNEALRQQNIALNATIASAIANERGKPEHSAAYTAYINDQTIDKDGYDEAWNQIEKYIDEEDRNLEKLYSLFYDKNTEGYLTARVGDKATQYYYDNGKLQSVDISQKDAAALIVAKIQEAAKSGDNQLMAQVHAIIDKSGRGDEVKELLNQLTITAQELDQVDIRAEQATKALQGGGFDTREDEGAISLITGQLEGKTEDIDFSSLTKEQYDKLFAAYGQGLFEYNADIQAKITKGINEYWNKRQANNITASVTFDIKAVDAQELSSEVQKAGATNADFIAQQKILQTQYGLNEDAAYGMAKANLQLQNGIKSVNKVLDTYRDTLESGEKTSIKYAQGINGLTLALTEWFGIDVKTDFVEKYLPDILNAADGNRKAIKKVQAAISREAVNNLEFNVSTKDGEDPKEELLGLVNLINSMDLSINMSLDDHAVLAQLGNLVNELIKIGQLSTEAGGKLLQSLGFEVNEGDIFEYKLTQEELDKIVDPTIKAQYQNSNIKLFDLKNIKYTGQGQTAILESAEKAKQLRKQRLKDLEKEIKRYHELEAIIQDTERAITKLGKAKERVYGQNKIALIKEEIKAQRQLLANNEELLKQANAYLKEDQKNLISNTSKKYTLEFDEQGNISNYEDIQRAWLKSLKSKVNSSSYDKLKEQYDNFEAAVQQYEETLQKTEDLQDKAEDIQDTIYDLNLEDIETTIELKIELADDQKAQIDFAMQQIEDDAFKAADAIGYLGQEAATTLSKINANNEGVKQIEEALAAGDITPAQAVEKLRALRDEAIDLNAELLELQNTVGDKLTAAFESWNEKIEEGINDLDFFGSTLSNYKNIIDIFGKDLLGISDDTMAQLNETIVKNANNNIRSIKAQLDVNKATLAELEKARQQADTQGDKKMVEFWDKQIKVAKDKSQELEGNLQDALTTGAEAAIESFGDAVNTIADNFSKAVSGIYDTITDMRQSWDRMGEVAERYLSVYQQTYEINKLNRQIQNSINSNDNVKAQRQLKELQSEIYEMTKSGQQMSKYDLQYLQKKYDLLLAEQALKDAQNAKDTARLVRDSSGSFGYVYTANQKNIADSQQSYDDKVYAYQQFVEEMDQTLAEMYISATERVEERLREAAEKYGIHSEEFAAEERRIMQEFEEDMNYISNEYGKLTDRNIKINRDFSADVASTYHDTFLGKILPDYNSFTTAYNGVTTICKKSISELDGAITGLRSTFETQLKLATGSSSSFETLVKEDLGNIASESDQTADAVDQLAKDMDTALNGSENKPGAIDAVQDFYDEYAKKMNKVRGETQTTINIVGRLIEKYEKLIETAKEANGLDTPGQYQGGNNEDGRENPGGYDGKTQYTVEAAGITPEYGKASYDYTKPYEQQSQYYRITNTQTGSSYYTTSDNLTNTKGKKINNADIGQTVLINDSSQLIGAETFSQKGHQVKWDGQHVVAMPGNTSYVLIRDTASQWWKVSRQEWNDAGQKKWYFVDPSKDKASLSSLFNMEEYPMNKTVQPVLNSKGDDRGHAFGSYPRRFKYIVGYNPQTDIITFTNNAGEYGWAARDATIKQWSDYTTEGYTPNEFTQRLEAYLNSFDTGGYTGSWGPEGRIAMLHQKEIVLNAHDTENLLSAIEIVRSIADRLDANARITAQGLGNLATAAAVTNNREVLEQNVTIHAEFPNATDHNEIELAFGDLINQASQYINRR